MHCLESPFGDRIIGRGFWLPSAPDLILCDSYSWGMLKDKVCRDNSHTEDDRKEKTIQDAVSSVVPAEYRQALNHAFFKPHTYLRAEGRLRSSPCVSRLSLLHWFPMFRDNIVVSKRRETIIQ
ncbi:hypothetical protein Cfor_11351 [Coptotermes formosanus]|uniref:Uncharacterized protein n=1 Tax=Coptotermes formosanus TaxID=36987 RepID=A0A6L2P8B4_COPFO|nr:hypothetical protein Cfor_11351 [Coptotermes formosanus]